MLRLSHDTKNMLVITIALCATPVLLVATRERPLRGDSAMELAQHVRHRRESQRDFLTKLPADTGIYSPTEFDQSWQRAATDLQNSGVEVVESNAVLKSARSALNEKYFCVFAERGWIQNRPAWVIEGAIHRGLSDLVGFCGNASFQERHMNSFRYGIVVVDAQAPHPILFTQIDNES